MNICFFCWLDPIEKAWTIFNAFIEYNWNFGGLHRLGMLWIVLHFWTDIILIIMLMFYLKDKYFKRKRTNAPQT